MPYKRRNYPLPKPSDPLFDPKVKEIIEIREGVRGNSDHAFVTFGDLKIGVDLGNSHAHGNYVATGKPVIGDGQPPNPPTNLSVVSRFFGNYLTWDNPSDADLSHVEVWMATTQSRSAATRIGIVTAPVNHFFHSMPSLDKTENHYYWLRAVDYSGLYSEWEPNDDQGGYLVSGDPSIEEQISNFIEAMKYEMDESTFRTNDDGHIIGFGHIYVGDDENNVVAILCDKFQIVNPSDSGDLKTPFIVGQVDGVSTVGIDGALVVDGTITAVAIDVGELSAISADVGNLTAGALHSVDWDTDGGIYIDLSNGIIKAGDDPSDPDLAYSNGNLSIRGSITVTGGSGVSNFDDYTPGVLPLANLIANPGFEDSTEPDWWTEKGSAVSIETTGGNDSNHWMKVTRSGSDAPSRAAESIDSTTRRYIEVNPGDVYEFGADIKTDGTCVGGVGIGVYDKDKGDITWVLESSTSTSWENKTHRYTVPSGKRYISLFVGAYTNDGWAGFDNVFLRKIDSLSAGWGHSSDITKIDGGNIYTGTITATQLIQTAAVITQTAQIDNGIITSAKIGTAEIKTANIEDASVKRLKVQDGDISKIESSYGSSQIEVSYNGTVISDSIVAYTDKAVVIMFSFYFQSNQTRTDYTVGLYRGSTLLRSYDVFSDAGTPDSTDPTWRWYNFSHRDTPGKGTFTYYVKEITGSGYHPYYKNRLIVLLSTFR